MSARSGRMASVSVREVVLLGSTGSIGTQAIDIARRNPDRFRIVGLGAGGGNVEVLARQALELGVDVVGVARRLLHPAGSVLITAPLRLLLLIQLEHAPLLKSSKPSRALVGPSVHRVRVI